MATKKTSDGTVDKRTKEGKAIAERMAKARAAAAKKKKAEEKKTAAKPASKKATPAKKAAPSKKGVAKATPAKKAAPAKKTTPVKKATPAKTLAVEISVTGNKKIGTLMKEFNNKFPYLRLKICYSYAREAVAKGESIQGIDIEKTLASVRRANSGGDISISGNKKVKSLEKEFDTVFGLYVQICYTESDGHRYYTSGSRDEMTLSALNSYCEDQGCKKGAWK